MATTNAQTFTIGGVTHQVEDVGARQLIADLQAALNAITSGDTTTAIKTFNEIIAFLDNIEDSSTLQGIIAGLNTAIAAKYTKPSTGIPATDLAQAVQTILNSVANKANSADVYPKSQTYTKSEVDAAVAEKQDVLTFDNAPTANSNNLVKSGGIKTALDNLLANISIGQNGNWFIGQTDTNVKAQGPAGNVQVDGNGNVLIVNNLEDGGTGAALSAEMGKELAGLVDELGYDVITTQHTQSLEVDSQNTGTVNANAESQTCEIDWNVPQSGGVPAFTNIANYPTYNGSIIEVPYLSPMTGANITFLDALTGDYANGGAKANHIVLRSVTFTLSGNATLVARYYFIINETTGTVTDMSSSTSNTQLSAGTYTVLTYGDTTYAVRPILSGNDGNVDVTSAFVVDLTDTYGSGNEPAKADVVDLFGDIRLGSSDSSYTPAGSSAVLSVTRGGTVADTATYGTDTEITVQGGDVLSLSGSGSASIDVDYTTTEREKRENVWTNQAASLLAVVLQHVTFDDASTGQAAANALITLLTTQNQQS